MSDQFIKEKNSHKCPECGYSFYIKANLKTHILVQFMNEKSHISVQTGYSSSIKANLKRHINQCMK